MRDLNNNISTKGTVISALYTMVGITVFLFVCFYIFASVIFNERMASIEKYDNVFVNQPSEFSADKRVYINYQHTISGKSMVIKHVQNGHVLASAALKISLFHLPFKFEGTINVINEEMTLSVSETNITNVFPVFGTIQPKQLSLFFETAKLEGNLSAHNIELQDVAVAVVLNDSLSIDLFATTSNVLFSDGKSFTSKNVHNNLLARDHNEINSLNGHYTLTLTEFAYRDSLTNPNHFPILQGEQAELSLDVKNKDDILSDLDLVITGKDIGYDNTGVREYQQQINLNDFDRVSFTNLMLALFKETNHSFNPVDPVSLAGGLFSKGLNLSIDTQAKFNDIDKLELTLNLTNPADPNFTMNPLASLNTTKSNLFLRMPTVTAIDMVGMESMKKFISSGFGVLKADDKIIQSNIRLEEGKAVVNGKELLL